MRGRGLAAALAIGVLAGACGADAAPSASWDAGQKAKGDGWELVRTADAPADAPVGIELKSATADQVRVVLTVPAGGPNCKVAVFGGIEPTGDVTIAHIKRASAPDAPSDCTLPGTHVAFTLALTPRPTAYTLQLQDGMSCRPTCGTMELKIEP
jgi:hypothetical protein